ncbi:MAG: entericidin A/B family lipoprotein [Nitrospirae bacterium]|nr:entericidin A/B family lipoprotein [Nitrospirota bacterium]
MCKKGALTILIILCMIISTRCNTMQGIGKDIKGAGQAIEKAAD